MTSASCPGRTLAAQPKVTSAWREKIIGDPQMLDFSMI
jgi:hypothetical protein